MPLTQYLFPRRFDITYESPAVCDVEVSSSGFPTIIIPPIVKPAGFQGNSLLWNTETTIPRLEWPQFPGALCYTVYLADDPYNPFGTYHVVAECLPPLEGDQPPMGGNDEGEGDGPPIGGSLDTGDLGDFGYAYIEIIIPTGELLWGGPPFGFGDPPEPAVGYPYEWWTFNSDFIGSANATELIPMNSSVSYVAGVEGNAVRFAPADSGVNNFPHVTGGGPALQYEGNGFSVVGWFKCQQYNFGAGAFIFQYTVSTIPVSNLALTLGGDALQILADLGGGQYQAFPITIPFVPTLGTWYFFAMTYDGLSGTFRLSINDGAQVVGDSTFVLAAVNNGPGMLTGTSGYLEGGGTILVMDSLAIFPSNLQPNQISYLYNFGSGQTWPITLPDPIVPT